MSVIRRLPHRNIDLTSAFIASNIPPPIPEAPLDPSSPIGSGYAESKWVAEQILYNATKTAGVPTVVVRLGQISGDKTGHWNEREWFPALVKSAGLASCLPVIEGVSCHDIC